MALFRIAASFAVQSRNLFVLAGDVVEGRIVPGMLVRIRCNSSVAMTAPVHAVEYIRHSTGPEQIGLCIRCEDDDELEVWRGLNIGPEVVEVAVPDA